MMKIYAGFATMWYNSEMYKNRLNRQLEEDNIKMMQQDERVKGIILTQIHRELIKNETMSTKGKVCNSVVLSVDAKYRNSLKRVLNHKDFLPYNTEIVKETEDIRKAFKDMPILLKVSKKVI